MSYKEEIRFQDCSTLIKIWRFRHYISVPVTAARIYLRDKRNPADPEEPIQFSEAWSVALGFAQIKMNWWYTLEECFGEN